METRHTPDTIDAPAPVTSHPALSVGSPQRCGRGGLFLLVVSMILAGFAGGLLSPLAVRLYQERVQSKQDTVKTAKVKTTVVTEENMVPDLVEKKSPGVVSIVISKDVPRIKNSFGNSGPFGMLPFFDPFGSMQQQSPQSPQGTNGSGTEKQKVGSGSGFFITADGMIVTNKHVVADEQADYTVIDSNEKEYKAKVLGRDPVNDIAIIKIEGKSFPALDLGDSDKVRVGETVIAMGNPLGEFANSVSRGIVSGLKRNLDASSGFGGDSERLTDIIQIDAAINPGNSGGPLFNLAGEVIGVNVAMAQGAQSIGFSLPINQVKHIADQVRTTGKISTPYLGIRSIVLTADIQKQNSLPFDYGALVLRGQTLTDFAVIPGSPADKAGIVESDIILEVNGTKVDANHPLTSFMARYVVGDVITLKVWHKGETKDIKVKLEERK